MCSGSPAQFCGHRGRRRQLLQSSLVELHRTALPGAWPRASCTMSVSASAASCCSTLTRWNTNGCWCDGAATETESITRKDTGGVRNPCSFRTAYTDAGGLRLNFEVNGEHMQGWDYSNHADAGTWRRRRNYHSLMSPIIIHRLVQYLGTSKVVQYLGLYRSYLLCSFPYHRFCSFICITSFLLFY